MTAAAQRTDRTAAETATSVTGARPLTLADLVSGALADQQPLTAVERFSQWHADHEATPAQAKHYRSLVPAALPAAGQQYAFDVDLDACSGCKSCVVACHSLNGLDELESWRDVGLLTQRDDQAPAALQYVTTACHHCLEPACAIGCPVNAYEKDPVTGIVRHLDDQCFGCSYCTLACPYEVPKYHEGKGIVRKCDMCSHRLAAGEAPACVQSCPNEAIRITVVDAEEVRARSQHGALVPGATASDFTQPTTRFHSKKHDLSQFRPADEGHSQPQHAHAALVVMLVLTQLAVGVLLAAAAWMGLGEPGSVAGRFFLQITATVAATAAVAGVAAATFHLGRPQYAFRALLGVTHSWLSREILAFGVFMPLAVTSAAMTWTVNWPWTERWLPVAAGSAAVAGVVALWCSVRIYQFTRRLFWRGPHTSVKFLLTTALLGAAVAWAAASWSGLSPDACQSLAFAVVGVAVTKLLLETTQLRAGSDGSDQSVAESAQLMRTELRSLVTLRVVLGFTGGVAVPVAAVLTGGAAWAPAAALSAALCLAGELCERTLFFQAVVPLRMPGGWPA